MATVDASKGEWRCACQVPDDPGASDTSVQPEYVAACGTCAARRPVSRELRARIGADAWTSMRALIDEAFREGQRNGLEIASNEAARAGLAPHLAEEERAVAEDLMVKFSAFRDRIVKGGV
jgi:hypothetical protein